MIGLAAATCGVGCDREETPPPPAPKPPADVVDQSGRMMTTRNAVPRRGIGLATNPVIRPTPTGNSNFVTVGDLAFNLPPGWSSREGTGMRAATFVHSSGVEISVTRLNGDGGGVLNNINRWRGQVFLPPWEQGDLAANTGTFDASGIEVTFVDIAGSKGRIVGAVIPSGGMTWFLKAQVEQPAALDDLAADVQSIAASIKPGAKP
jgi:hypothetical protein